MRRRASHAPSNIGFRFFPCASPFRHGATPRLYEIHFLEGNTLPTKIFWILSFHKHPCKDGACPVSQANINRQRERIVFAGAESALHKGSPCPGRSLNAVFGCCWALSAPLSGESLGGPQVLRTRGYRKVGHFQRPDHQRFFLFLLVSLPPDTGRWCEP